MKGDFSRITFRPEKGYSRVLMQQGRVQLDSDWNEQMAILGHRNEIQMSDVIGVSGAPADSHGFQLYLRSGLDFRADGFCIAIESPEAFAFSGSAAFTIEAWICPRTGGPVLANSGSAPSGGYALAIDSDLAVRFERDVTSGHDKPLVRFGLATERKLAVGKYSHVAVVCERERISIYISGELAAAGTCPGRPAKPVRALWMGDRADGTGFDGEIADLRIWDVARSESDIHRDRRGLSKEHHPHLVGWYLFEASAPRLIDSSGHGHHGVFVKEEADRPTWLQRLWVQSGRYYVNGITCDVPADFQIDVPSPDPNAGTRSLVWLDVQEDSVNSIEDPSIRELALGGADTAGRARFRWQVRLLTIPESEWEQEATGEFPTWVEFRNSRHLRPLMLARTQGRADAENRLYRVEIGQPSAPDREAAFMWSRDNGSVVFPIRDVEGDQAVRLDRTGSDELSLHKDTWIQLCDENTSSSGQPPVLVRVLSVDRISRVVTFTACPFMPSGKNRFIRVWNQSGITSVVYIGPDEWISLEHGIQVRFPANQNCQPGDYWLIPFRSGISDIEWPRDEQGNPRPVPAHREGKCECLLGLVGYRFGALEILHDYRLSFAPLTRIAADERLFVKKTGDSMTGSLDIAGSLRVEERVEGEKFLPPGAVKAREVIADVVNADVVNADVVNAKEVSGGLLTGQLDSAMVDTPQLCDESVTKEKLAPRSVDVSKLDFKIPELAEGFSLLRDKRKSVPGYDCVNRLLIHDIALPWSRPEGRDTTDGPVRAVGCGEEIYAISESSGEMWALDVDSGTYRKRAPLPRPRRGFGLVELNGKIYVIGGLESNSGKQEIVDSVMVYDPSHDLGPHHSHGHHPHGHHAWREAASLNHPRAYPGVASARGKLFALGGEVGSFPLNRRTAVCELLDPDSGDSDWTECGRMIEARSRFGVASYQGNLFAVGGVGTGYLGARTVGTVEKFYPELIGGDWSCLLSPLPVPRSDAAVGFLDDRLFCIGGRTEHLLYSLRFTRDCQLFRPELNYWAAGPHISFARSQASPVTRGNTLFAVGGAGPCVKSAEVVPVASFYYVYNQSERGGSRRPRVFGPADI
jgi:hypothetical protein